jgi:hypothetical protein
LKQLNLPEYSFKISGKEGEEMILDTIRRKWVRLTPEEWVRQNFIRYLIDRGKYPPGLLGIEKLFRQNKLKRRTDILVHNRAGEPVMIVECKSPDIVLDDNLEVFDQIVRYNLEYGVPFIVLTNGLNHYAFRAEPGKNYKYLNYIPLYEDLLI